MDFEWDENKRLKTLNERGIDFIDATKIWKDPMRQERIDTRKDHGEIRMQTIGRVHFGLLFVVYTERIYENDDEVIRIISARMANERDKDEYNKMTFHARLYHD